MLRPDLSGEVPGVRWNETSGRGDDGRAISGGASGGTDWVGSHVRTETPPLTSDALVVAHGVLWRTDVLLSGGAGEDAVAIAAGPCKRPARAMAARPGAI